MSWVAALLMALYAALTLARAGLAWRFFANAPAVDPADEADVTVLQPILSGDPALTTCLQVNLRATPMARFLWLIDEDDPERSALETLAAEGADVLIGPPPADGENPKVAKLARALPLVATRLVAVLDDDTMLRPGDLARAAGALAGADLAYGLPVYESGGGLWSRLLAAAVNGAAVLTYPAAAKLGESRTINGMFYVTRTADLRALCGFEAIRARLTDDHALATLYLRAGKRLAQTPVAHRITTTVRDGRHYVALTHRWMVFVGRYLRENLSPFTAGLIMAPTLLPPLMLSAAGGAGAGWMLAALALLVAKAGLTATLRGRWMAAPARPLDLLLEPIADLLAPFQFVHALVRPRRIAWRSRRIRLDGEALRYE